MRALLNCGRRYADADGVSLADFWFVDLVIYSFFLLLN
jgi:hypothetical protein